MAFANRDDPLHPRARRTVSSIVDGKWGRPWTSDYVFAESLNFVRGRVRREEVADAVTGLVLGRPAHAPIVGGVLRVSPTIFAVAHDRYFQHWAAGLSLTDWTSLELMDERGVETMATFDTGFRAWARVVP